MLELFTKILFVFLIILSLSKAQQCNIKGQCEDSDLQEIIIAKDSIDCLKACQDNSECNWYTYRPQNHFSKNYCFLWKNCSSISFEKCEKCVTGQKTCPYYKCNQPGYCKVTF